MTRDLKRCSSGKSPKQVVVTAVYGNHADRLDYTFKSFARNPDCELHAFVVGRELPKRRVEAITYHQRDADAEFGHPLRDVDFRRWLFLDDLKADLALVVDGMDVLCLRPLEPFESLLKGGWVGAAVEHAGGRYLAGGLYTSNFVNAGVTFWDIKASAPIRQEIAARGRRRYRNQVDDQLALNELLHTRFMDRLTLLPCHYNYRGSLGRKPFGWPTTRNLDGVRLYHNRHWIEQAKRLSPAGKADLSSLPEDKRNPGQWTARWRRLGMRFQRTGYAPWWPQW